MAGYGSKDSPLLTGSVALSRIPTLSQYPSIKTIPI
jgi:hypothetical protein